MAKSYNDLNINQIMSNQINAQHFSSLACRCWIFLKLDIYSVKNFSMSYEYDGFLTEATISFILCHSYCTYHTTETKTNTFVVACLIFLKNIFYFFF